MLLQDGAKAAMLATGGYLLDALRALTANCNGKVIVRGEGGLAGASGRPQVKVFELGIFHFSFINSTALLIVD